MYFESVSPTDTPSSNTFFDETMDEAQKVKNAKGARYNIKKLYYHPYALRTYAVRPRALLKHSPEVHQSWEIPVCSRTNSLIIFTLTSGFEDGR